MSTWEAGQGSWNFRAVGASGGRGLHKNSLAGVEPAFGVHLLGRDPNIEAVAALRKARQRAASEPVEVACGGASDAQERGWRCSPCSAVSPLTTR